MIANSRFKAMNIGTTPELILMEGKKRKSVLIQNTDSSTTLRIGNNRNLNSSNEYINIPPNSVLTLEIPEDNPREPIWAYVPSGSVTTRIYEAYAK